MTLRTNLLNDKADNNALVVASDVEGTLTAGTGWVGMRAYLEANGEGDTFKQFLRQRMFKVIQYRLGLLRNEQRFKMQWLQDLLHLFAGYPEERMMEMGQFVMEQEVWPKRRQVVADELLVHKKNGRRVILVTGVIEPILSNIARKLEIEAIGTPLQYENGVFTGELALPFNTGKSKVEQLQLVTHNGSLLSAYGDTAADIPMLTMCQEAVAVHPDKNLRKTAVANNWRILE